MAKPLIIVPDTSTLRGLSPRGLEAAALRRLALGKVIEIHVPDIVERELSSQLADLLKRPSNEYFVAAGWAPDEQREALTDALGKISEVCKGARNTIGNGVKEWLDHIGAVREKVTDVNVEVVFDRYFEGLPPFGARKSRNDIPDAFVLGALEALARNPDFKVHAVCADKRLRKACGEVTGVTVHEDITSLFAAPEIASTISASRALAFCVEHTAELSQMLEELLGEAVYGQEIYSSSFPSDNQDATITMFGNATDIQLDFDNMEPIADTVVLIPVRCRVPENLADICIFKGDYYALEGSRDLGLSISHRDWNDHYLMAQFQVDLEMEGTITVEVIFTSDDKAEFGTIEVSIEDLAVADSAVDA